MSASVQSHTADETSDVVPGAAPLRTSTVMARHRNGSSATLELHGELCPSTAASLQSEIDRLVEAGVIHLTVDLRGLRFCTSHGLDVFQAADERLRVAGGSVRLRGASGVVRHVLEVVEHSDPTFSPRIR